MPNYLIAPRILFVVYEAVFMPEGSGGRTNFINDSAGGFGDFPAGLIGSLIELGCDVHVAQPDFRNIFETRSRKEKSGATVTLTGDRIHLAKDRTLYYSKPVISNSQWENLKISLAFQREVINQIIPRVQPDLIHCYDWMTGLIPAAAKKNEIPCLFTIQKLDSARSMLADVEDIGIDAAGFWQNLFYNSYPGSYEQTRDTNPLDLLLSGILAANQVNAAWHLLLPNIAQGRSDPAYSPLKELLTQKWKAGCAWEIPYFSSPGPHAAGAQNRSGSFMPDDQHAGNPKNDHAWRQHIPARVNRTTAKCYLDLYEKILQRPLVTSETKKVWSIDKNNGINIPGIRAIPYRRVPGIKSHAFAKKQVSTVAMAPI